MQGITFALPTLSEGAMSTVQQANLVREQVTAVIVCGYLEHMNAAIAKGAPGEPIPDARFITQAELVALIREVRKSL